MEVGRSLLMGEKRSRLRRWLGVFGGQVNWVESKLMVTFSSSNDLSSKWLMCPWPIICIFTGLSTLTKTS